MDGPVDASKPFVVVRVVKLHFSWLTRLKDRDTQGLYTQWTTVRVTCTRLSHPIIIFKVIKVCLSQQGPDGPLREISHGLYTCTHSGPQGGGGLPIYHDGPSHAISRYQMVHSGKHPIMVYTLHAHAWRWIPVYQYGPFMLCGNTFTELISISRDQIVHSGKYSLKVA